MSPFVQAIQGLHWGWKAIGGFLGGLVVAIPIIVGWAQGPIEENHVAHEAIYGAIDSTNMRVDAIVEGQDTIRADVGLVRCWVRHQIQGTDATACLVDSRRE